MWKQKPLIPGVPVTVSSSVSTSHHIAILDTYFIHVTVPLSLDSIFEEVMKSEAGRSMTLDRVRASLDQLGCPSSMGIDESYSIGTVYPIFSFQLLSVEKENFLMFPLSRFGLTFSFLFFLLFSSSYWNIHISYTDLKKIIELAQNDEVCLICVSFVILFLKFSHSPV